MNPTTILIGGFVAAVLLLIIGLIVSVMEERSLVEERLGRYLEEQVNVNIPVDRSAPVAEWLTRQAGRFSWSDNLSKELARADIKLRVGEYIIVVLAAVLGSAVIAWFLGGRTPMPAGLISLGIGGVIGFFIPRSYVGRMKGQRLIHFDEQLPDMLNLMVNGLRAGYSTMQAMEAVSKELPAPISDEFRRVVQEMQLGIPMERSLDNLVRRIPSKDLDLVVTAINVQREVGGNLAEILATISHTIRERVRVKGEIRVLTTQAMTSAKFLSAMPVFVLIALYFVNRPYIEEFFAPKTRYIGIPALITGALMIFFGYTIMKKIANIDI